MTMISDNMIRRAEIIGVTRISHSLYMVFGTIEWGLGTPKVKIGYLEETWGLFHVPPDPLGATPKRGIEFVGGISICLLIAYEPHMIVEHKTQRW